MAANQTLTLPQAIRLLDNIANSAKTLQEFAMDSMGRVNGVDMCVVQALAERIGMVADWATGCAYFGTPSDWAVGTDRDFHHEAAATDREYRKTR